MSCETCLHCFGVPYTFATELADSGPFMLVNIVSF